MTPQPGSTVRLDLTPKQQNQLKQVVGHSVETLELSVEELEERISPRIMKNHNEPLLSSRRSS